MTVRDNCNIYARMDETSRVISKLTRDEFVEYIKIKKHKRYFWYKIKLDRYSYGFVNRKYGYNWERGIVKSGNSYLIPLDGDYTDKVELTPLSLVRFVMPVNGESSGYKIQTWDGILGNVASSAKIERLDLFIYDIINAIVFVAVFLISFYMIFKVQIIDLKTGAFLSLILAAVISIVVTFSVMIIMFLIKFLYTSIKSKL